MSISGIEIIDGENGGWSLIDGSEWQVQRHGPKQGLPLVVFVWDLPEPIRVTKHGEPFDSELFARTADEWRHERFCGPWGHVTPHRGCILR
jgi:hypothetical protein